jgi:hypothetical protein
MCRADGVSSDAARASLDTVYTSQLAITVQTAYDYFVAFLESGSDRPSNVPAPLLSQARLAASVCMSLELLLRRCVAMNSLFTLYLIQESERTAVSDDCKMAMLQKQTVVFDRVIDVASREYSAELDGVGSIAARHLRVARELLAGGMVDRSSLPYEFEGWHLAAYVEGEEASTALNRLAKHLDARLLVIRPGDSTRWAWLRGGQARNDRMVRDAVRAIMPVGLPIAFGRWERGIAGWRATHAQARAAFAICLRTGSASHYEDVALEASTIHDRVLSSFLRRRYLDPISGGRQGEATLPNTLRAYFAADRNGVSAAAALGVSRQTVTNRLHAVEERLGCSLSSCASDLELAFRIEAIERACPERAPRGAAPSSSA